MYPLLTERPELALAAGGAALARLADLPDIDPNLLGAIEAHLPTGRHVDLDPAAAAIIARLHSHRLAAAPDDATRASLYFWLGYRLANTGRREEALAATAQAVEIRRRLAAARPDAFTPDLASALTNLGMDLSGLGRREEALDVSCLDRVYLNGFVAKLQTPGGVIYFLHHHRGKPITSPALFEHP